jgi:hypothetical protein
MIQDQIIWYKASVVLISPPVDRDGSGIHLEDGAPVCANFALPYPTPILIFGDSFLKSGDWIMDSQHFWRHSHFLAGQDTAEVPKLTRCYMSGGSSWRIVAGAHRYQEGDRQFS